METDLPLAHDELHLNLGRMREKIFICQIRKRCIQSQEKMNVENVKYTALKTFLFCLKRRGRPYVDITDNIETALVEMRERESDERCFYFLFFNCHIY